MFFAYSYIFIKYWNQHQVNLQQQVGKINSWQDLCWLVILIPHWHFGSWLIYPFMQNRNERQHLSAMNRDRICYKDIQKKTEEKWKIVLHTKIINNQLIYINVNAEKNVKFKPHHYKLCLETIYDQLCHTSGSLLTCGILCFITSFFVLRAQAQGVSAVSQMPFLIPSSGLIWVIKRNFYFRLKGNSYSGSYAHLPALCLSTLNIHGASYSGPNTLVVLLS